MKPAATTAKAPTPPGWATALGRSHLEQLQAAGDAVAAARKADLALRETFGLDRATWWATFTKACRQIVADYCAGRGADLLAVSEGRDRVDVTAGRAVLERIAFTAKLDHADTEARPGFVVTSETPRGRESQPYTFALEDGRLVLALGDGVDADGAARALLEPWLTQLATITIGGSR